VQCSASIPTVYVSLLRNPMTLNILFTLSFEVQLVFFLQSTDDCHAKFRNFIIHTFLQRVRIACNAKRYNSHGTSVIATSVRLSRSGVLSRRIKIRSCTRSSVSDMKIILVSGEVKFIRIFAGITPARSLK